VPEPDLGWVARNDLDTLVDVESAALFLGLEHDGARFALAVPEAVRDGDLGPRTSSFMGVREVAPLLEVPDASVVALGRSLIAWHATHGHCPNCGARTSMAEAGHARRCTGDVCGTVQFPRTDPVVIMLIHREGQCLLGRAIRARRYPPGLHSCLAGYVEPGESIEEAVRRETWEEAGLIVGNVRYHSSQPWPFPSTLMIGCFAEALSGETRIDSNELESVRWFTPVELQKAVERWDEAGALRVPPPLTIAHQLAGAWLVERSG
jgi:NAD+ diphosphatase